jgi:hypothetical protein
VQARNVVSNGRAWQVLRDLAAGCAALEEILGDHCAAGQALSPVASGDPRRPARSRTPGRAMTRIPPPRAWPFHASSRLVAALARPPARSVPGIRFVLRPDFDVTPETFDTERAGEIIACDPKAPHLLP